MKTIFGIAAALILAGCAMTPADVVEQGTRHHWASRSNPSTVAICLSKNIESQFGAPIAVMRPSGTNSFEVAERWSELGVVSLWQIAASGDGSSVTIFVAPNMGADALVGRLSRGC